MSQEVSQFPENAVVSAGTKQKNSDPRDAPGSTNSPSSHDICSQLKSNCVIALSSLAQEGEGKWYAVRCLVAGVWSLQLQGALQPYDPSVQLVVVNQNGKLGFRSAIAEGRLLRCNSQCHLGFERWQMDCQEAWTLQGCSLSSCTLRNEMYKITLKIRITVLAEPTDLLGNPRITSALITTALSWSNSAATSNSNRDSSSHVNEESDQKGGKSSNETPRLLLVRTETNTKFSNPFAHQRDRSNPEEVKSFCTKLSKVGAPIKPCFSSESLHESKGTSFPRCGVFAFSSWLKTDTQNISLPTQDCTERGIPDNQRISLKGATTWKPRTPSRNEGQFSSFPVTSRTFGPESQLNANIQGRNGSHVSEAVISPRYASTTENPRKVRKWKRNSEGNQKVLSVDLEGNNRSSCGLKRSQDPLYIDVMDEDGTFLSPGSSNKCISPRDGGHSSHVVIKRQTGFLATKVDLDSSPRIPRCSVEAKISEDDGGNLKYSKTQMEAALNNLRKDTARQEKEKIIHWKLQAAVRLLKTETEQKLTLIAKAAFEEAYARTFKEDMDRNSWFSKEKRTVNSKLLRNSRPATTNTSSHQNKRAWTYPFERESAAKEVEVSLAVSQMLRTSSSRLQMSLKLWLFLPVPLLSLAYVILIYRTKKKADA